MTVITIKIRKVGGHVEVEFDRAIEAGVHDLQIIHDLAIEILHLSTGVHVEWNGGHTM